MPNTTPSFNKYARRMKAMGYGLRYPLLLKQLLRISVEFLYAEGILKKGGIRKKSLGQLFDLQKEIRVQNLSYREGNASYCEMLALATIVANHSPKNLLEIGTFDGNTTLQIALNSPLDAVIHTIDLPKDQSTTSLPILDEDLKYIRDQAKYFRKYKGTSVESKIVQHFGDSTAYDFSKFVVAGPIDFCFIDGGHSYTCVKSDTENTLKILSPRGIILWHDFSPNCPENYRYLCELNKTLPLIHLEGTSLVLYKNQEARHNPSTHG